MVGEQTRRPVDGAPAHEGRSEPWGVFSLTHGSAPVDTALARPYVRGACVRAYWRDFEPEEGRFVWALFDETLARARRHGKRAAFRVMNGTGTPEWVYAAGAAAYDPRDRGVSRLPLPWDDVFFAKWRAFVAALGRRYDGDSDVAYVAMSMPAGRWAELLFPVSLPEVAGYSMERFVDAHRRVIEVYAEAFPHTPLTLAITGHEYDGSLQRVVADLTDHIGERFGPDNRRVVIQANGWSERTVMGRNTTVDRTFDACFAKPIRHGLQQIAADSWTLRRPTDVRMGDQFLANAVLLRYRAQYAEVYEGDVAGDRVQPALEQLGTLLVRRAWLDSGGRLHADGVERVVYSTDLSDPAAPPAGSRPDLPQGAPGRSLPQRGRAREGAGTLETTGQITSAAREARPEAPPFTRTAYVRYAAYDGGRAVLQGGFPFWGPALYDPQRRVVAVPGAARLRYTSDGTYPVPIRPDWALSRTAVTIDGDTLAMDDVAPNKTAALRVVPIVLRDDGKEALGDVYEVPVHATTADGVRAVPPLAAVEDLGQKE